MKALSLGLHVMLFSDNVSVAEERAIKTHARDKGLLVMGPDCGTAIVNGVPLGFANVVRRGDIGLGRCLGHRTAGSHLPHPQPGRWCLAGAGHRRARPEGGDRRHHDAAGAGRACRRCAHAGDRADLQAARAGHRAPDRGGRRRGRQAGRRALPRRRAHAAAARPARRLVVAPCRGRGAGDRPRRYAPPSATATPPAAGAIAAVERRIAEMAPSQTAVRGLFTGGTFCYEAQLAFIARGLACRSNAPAAGAGAFDGRFDGHVFLDLGDDDYTRCTCAIRPCTTGHSVTRWCVRKAPTRRLPSSCSTWCSASARTTTRPRAWRWRWPMPSATPLHRAARWP